MLYKIMMIFLTIGTCTVPLFAGLAVVLLGSPSGDAAFSKY